LKIDSSKTAKSDLVVRSLLAPLSSISECHPWDLRCSGVPELAFHRYRAFPFKTFVARNVKAELV